MSAYVTPSSITYPGPKKARARRAHNSLDDDNTSVSHKKRKTNLTPEPSLADILSSEGNVGVRWAQRFRPKATSDQPALCIDLYRSALDQSDTFMYPIDPRTWVAEIYDPITQDKGRGVDSWVVLQGVFDSSVGAMQFVCCKWCPDKIHYGTSCLHELVLNGEDKPDCLLSSSHDNPTATAFRWTPAVGNEPALIIYCIMAANREPTIVAFNGFFANSGIWTCRRCKDVKKCVHIAAAETEGSHERLLRHDAEPGIRDADESQRQVTLHMATLLDKANRNSQQSLHGERSVSHRPVGPPRWCRMPTDPSSLASHHVSSWPNLIPLELDPRCRCGAPSDKESPIREISCTIFDVSSATRARIQIQACSSCPREWNMNAGPDLGDLGLFNLNNSRLFTHALLNDYTNSMSSLEAPFHSFCDVVNKRYSGTINEISFAGEDSFRTAWFSFTRIQHLYGYMHCEECGDNPDYIIFDGQTGGFSADHATSTLCPPTTIMSDSPRRVGASPEARKTAAVLKAVGKRARLAVRWRMGLNSAGRSPTAGIDSEDTLDDAADADIDISLAQVQQKTRLSARDVQDAAMRGSLEGIAQELERDVLPELGFLFRAIVASPFDLRKEEVRQPYLEFLSQVFAHESVLQLLPEKAFIPVHWLLADDGDATAALLTSVPALGTVARIEFQHLKRYTSETKTIAKWLMDRSAKVRASLPKHHPESPRSRDLDQNLEVGLLAQPAVFPPRTTTMPSSGQPLFQGQAEQRTAEQTATRQLSGQTNTARSEDPRETGSFYGRPRIRSCPVYTNLPGDGATDRAVVTEEVKSVGIGCSKYYETYGIRGLTGGIMAAWCPHMICLGFHCIPKGEGRNDVFSALYCYWETAPRYVIYDFACALAPYCMAREPQFFANTTFLVDSFHSKGHTRCSKACMLSFYQLNDPQLCKVNSSAAECGNAGLRKIRRPLSYMSQRHAIVYTMTFLSVWNRARQLDAVRRTMRAPTRWSLTEIVS